MTERSGVHLRHQDLGSGFALWVSEMIQDGKQQFSKEGCVFLRVGDEQARAREQDRLSEPVEAA
jgi:hypothetical protein